MKRSTSRWTTAIAAAALIGVPAAGWSQTPPAASPPPAAQRPADATAGSPAEHIRLAEAALNDIPASTLPASAKSRVADLKRHLNALERSAAASPAKPKNTWAKDVASIDKTLNELLGSASGGAASTPPTTAGTSGQISKSATLTLDDTSKAKLMEVRQHVTAFAASMSSAGSGAPAPTSEPSPEPAAATAAQAPAANPAPTAESTPPTSASAATHTTPSAQAAPPSAQPTEQTQAQAPTASAASSQVDEDAAKRHLTSARDSLAQLTQLPAAAQLTGDARTQVSQLISNFNELITAKADWKAAYDKVSANVTALIGAESAAPEAAAAAPAGTPGAVGTSGSTAAALDPAIKGKLVEFRTHLMAFEKAAGTSTGGSETSAPASSASAASPSASSAPSSGPSPSSAEPSASPSSSSPDPDPAPRSNPPGQSSAQSPSAGQASPDGAISHITAIESMIVGSGSKLTLEPAQVEQIRMHLAELRKAIESK